MNVLTFISIIGFVCACFQIDSEKYIKPLIILACTTLFFTTICFIPIRVSKLIPIIEECVAQDLGINIHVERLILRFGPQLKLKTPIMHVTYSDGQKFAQFDNVKFYIPWTALLKDNIKIKRIDARKFKGAGVGTTSIKIEYYISKLKKPSQKQEASHIKDAYIPGPCSALKKLRQPSQSFPLYCHNPSALHKALFTVFSLDNASELYYITFFVSIGVCFADSAEQKTNMRYCKNIHYPLYAVYKKHSRSLCFDIRCPRVIGPRHNTLYPNCNPPQQVNCL